MSDFDTILERLVSDPAFAKALAADPAGTLAGYRLSADELAVLTAAPAGEAGGDHAVEARTSQSTLSGLLTPLPGSGGGLHGGSPISSELGGPPAAQAGFGAAPEQAVQGFGTAPEVERGLGTAPEVERGFGTAPPAGAGGEAGKGAAGPGPGAGPGPDFGAGGKDGKDAAAGIGTVGDPAHSGLGEAPKLPEGYQTRVDVDGDGSWDPHTLHATAGGGVEIHVDLDGDGQVDFIGHDTNGDGLVDWAEYDRTGDGKFDTRMYDDDGDGWLDRGEPAG